MSERPEFLLALDESGDFGAAGFPVVVGGCLISGPDSPALQRRLHLELLSCAPHLLYPLHTAHLDRVAFHLVAWSKLPSAKRKRIDSAFAVPLTRAEQAVAAIPGAPLELLRSEGMPSLPRLYELSNWLEAHARTEAFVPLQAVQEAVSARFSSLLDALKKQRGVVAVAATEVRPPQAQLGTGDRYLDLLGVLLERVFLALQPHGEARLVLRVASRGVIRPGGQRLLTRTDVEALLGQVRQLPSGARLAPRLEVVVMEPEPYDSKVHPAVVLADQVVNRMRRPLALLQGLPKLEAAVRRHTGLELELRPPSPGPGVPTVASDGAPRALVLAALEGRPPPTLEPCRMPWAQQQAERVVAALRAGTAGGEVLR